MLEGELERLDIIRGVQRSMAGVCSKTVMVVDDDDQIREVMRQILDHEGYKVASAGNGSEAMAYLRSSGEPCLILLDLMMPVMDGWEFRSRQRKDPQLAEIPVVVVSALANVGERAESLEADGYLRKPVDFDDLLTTVERYCG